MSDPFRQQYRKLTEDEVQGIDSLKTHAANLGGIIHGFVPEGRERSLALTKLEEAVMWATKGITA